MGVGGSAPQERAAGGACPGWGGLPRRARLGEAPGSSKTACGEGGCPSPMGSGAGGPGRLLGSRRPGSPAQQPGPPYLPYFPGPRLQRMGGPGAPCSPASASCTMKMELRAVLRGGRREEGSELCPARGQAEGGGGGAVCVCDAPSCVLHGGRWGGAPRWSGVVLGDTRLCPTPKRRGTRAALCTRGGSSKPCPAPGWRRVVMGGS